MESSLRATLHDPLWLLARQWMLGEFQGEDAGSPAKVDLRATAAPLTRYTPRPGASDASEYAYDVRSQPLEALVERERVRDEGRNLRLAAEAGLHFTRLLASNGMKKHQAAFVSEFPLRWPAVPAETLDGATQRYLGVMANRVPDGNALAKALRTPLVPGSDSRPLPAVPAIPAADRVAVTAAVTAYLGWYDGGVFDEPPAVAGAQPTGGEPTSAWLRDRMEYEFALAAPGVPKLELAAPEYVEGSLDWFAFDLRSPGPPPAAAPSGDPTHVTIPSPVMFRGMPASRYWEFEDASVNLSAVRASSKDLGRMLILEFALVFGNDWFVVPVDLDVGSACRIDWLTVTNTFGERIQVDPFHATPGAGTEWAMFTPALDRRVGHGADDGRALLVLPPTVVSSLESPPIEEVLLVRDEMANLAWAVERVVESRSGRPLNRYEEIHERRRAGGGLTVPPATGAARVAYELGSDVPENWIPLVPEYLTAGSIQFRRARMGTASQPGPLGRILDVGNQLVLREEEVPRAGARVTRAYQYARWIDGSTHLWIGRRKAAGRGESSSDLQFDRIRKTESGA